MKNSFIETNQSASRLAQAFFLDADTEKTAKCFAQLLAAELDNLLDDEDMLTNILDELTYWLQPATNPYFNEK